MAATLTPDALAKILGPDSGYAADIATIVEDVRSGAQPGWPMARMELLANRLTNLALGLQEGGVRIVDR